MISSDDLFDMVATEAADGPEPECVDYARQDSLMRQINRERELDLFIRNTPHATSEVRAVPTRRPWKRGKRTWVNSRHGGRWFRYLKRKGGGPF